MAVVVPAGAVKFVPTNGVRVRGRYGCGLHRTIVSPMLAGVMDGPGMEGPSCGQPAFCRMLQFVTESESIFADRAAVCGCLLQQECGIVRDVSKSIVTSRRPA